MVTIDAIVNPIFPKYRIKFDEKLSSTIKKPSDVICITVFHFDRFVTAKLLLECKKKSLSPETITSLKIIISVGYTKIPDILLLSSKIINKATTKILSAIGSRNFQKFDSISNLRSIYPSKKSEKQANM